MKILLSFLLVVSVFHLYNSTIVLATADSVRKWEYSHQLRKEVKQLVLDEDFIGLEDLVIFTRKERLRYANSDWVLQDLYNSIPNSMATYERIYDFIKKWRSHSPDSNIPDVIEARAFLARAWEVRGNAKYGKLAESERKGFEEYLSKSWHSAMEAEKKGPADPELYNAMTELSFLLHADESLAKKYFEGCKKIEIGYHPAYFVMLNYLQPKWYGSNEELYEFVQDSAAATRHIDGEGLYALLLYNLTYNTNDIYSGEGGIFSWERTKTGFVDILRIYGKSPEVLHKYGFMAMLANDDKAFSDVIVETGTEWNDLKEKYYRSKRWYEIHLNRAKAYFNK